mmetsp:Transcript_11484/g.31324  ORF Transcript_11484/g.31324 Transcript_11484/m.31324 type:complete len:107 (+) Transcript_11484:563-883(+)
MRTCVHLHQTVIFPSKPGMNKFHKEIRVEALRSLQNTWSEQKTLLFQRSSPLCIAHRQRQRSSYSMQAALTTRLSSLHRAQAQTKPWLLSNAFCRTSRGAMTSSPK